MGSRRHRAAHRGSEKGQCVFKEEEEEEEEEEGRTAIIDSYHGRRLWRADECGQEQP